MKYFKKPAGQVFAFAPDGSQDKFITADMVPMTPAEVAAHVNPPASIDQIINLYYTALSKALDAQAHQWSYDSMAEAATYLNSVIPRFANESRVLIAWRDQAWHKAEALFAQVKAGQGSLPGSPDLFIKLVLAVAPTRPL